MMTGQRAHQRRYINSKRGDGKTEGREGKRAGVGGADGCGCGGGEIAEQIAADDQIRRRATGARRAPSLPADNKHRGNQRDTGRSGRGEGRIAGQVRCNRWSKGRRRMCYGPERPAEKKASQYATKNQTQKADAHRTENATSVVVEEIKCKGAGVNEEGKWRSCCAGGWRPAAWRTCP